MADTDLQLIWFYPRGGIPFQIQAKAKDRKEKLAEVAYWCHEKDSEWRPIETFLKPPLRK